MGAIIDFRHGGLQCPDRGPETYPGDPRKGLMLQPSDSRAFPSVSGDDQAPAD